jgi:hypothetical protein
MSRRAIAQAYATHRLAIKLTTAHRVAVDALAEERRCLREYLFDTHNDLARFRWVKSCTVFAVAQARLDCVVEEFSISAALANELAKGEAS